MTKKAAHDEQAEAERKQAEADKQFLVDLRDVLSVQSGYNVVFGILRHCRFLDEITDTSAQVYRQMGKQGVGLWLFGEVIKASPEALIELVNGIKREQAEELNKEASEEKKNG